VGSIGSIGTVGAIGAVAGSVVGAMLVTALRL
jgi:hypothetical protein